jgi:hypothetical protein
MLWWAVRGGNGPSRILNVKFSEVGDLEVVELYKHNSTTAFRGANFQHRLRVFENRVLRRIFGPKRDEVTGEWRKLNNEELHILYSSPSIIRQIKEK